jgi:DNA-binding PadR family transcriptional regulator
MDDWMGDWPPGPPEVRVMAGPSGPPGPHGHGPHGPHAQQGPHAPFPPGPPPTPPPPPPMPGAPYGFGPMPGGPGPKVKKGDVRAAALALLTEGPRNGYQIIQEIAERSQGIWRPSPGSVYPALQQLEDEGLVRAEEEAGRRTYRLTGEGRAHVAADPDAFAEPWAAVAESVSEDMVDMRSLFGQVGMAVRQVAQAGTAAQHGRARQILAETRRSLYRLLAEDTEEDE